jgi:iron complex transport system substrate-binding protein
MLTLPRRALAALTAVAATAALAACGTTEVPEAGEESSADTAAAISESCAEDTTATSTDPVTLTDDLGRTVELDEPAEATGRTERAEVVLGEFDDHIAAAKEQVAAADLPTTDFVYFDGWVEGGNVSIRPFGKGALFTALGEELGLTCVWTEETDPTYGLGQTDIEGLTTVGEANLIYTSTDDPEGNYVTELEKNDLWNGLPAVQEGRAHAFPAGIWTFGGPRSSQQAVDAYVEILTAP